jgi:hypothetical protein
MFTMKKQFISTIRICMLFLALGGWQNGFSQVSITAHNTDFNTNFNGWNGTLPGGFTRSGGNYQSTTASTTGGVYAISGAGFGYQPSSSVASCSLTGTFQNTTGSTITSLEISYDAFQIVNRVSRLPNWTVTSSLGSVSGLNWTFDNTTSPGNPDHLTITVNGLNLANNATFTLTFASDRGSGSGSSPLIGLNNVKVRSIATICTDPTNLAENNVTATSADFNWDTGGANTYEYVLDQTAVAPAGAGTNLTTNSFSTSTLSPATTYYFHLRRKCSASSFSNWVYVNFTTPAAPCNAPTGLAAANVTHNSSDLSWDTQGSNSFEYVVDQVAADPTGTGTSTAGTTFNPTGLNPLTTYYLHVRTNCVQGNTSAWTTISFTTAIEPCNAPTGLAAANVTHNSADLSWNTQGSSTYEYVVDQISTDPASGTATTGTTFNPTGLNPLTTYYLHVRTNCVQGNTSAWTTISFTTLIEPCNAPSGLTAANVTHNSADLSWNAQGASTYEYVVDQISTDPASGTATTGTTFNSTGLNPLTTYYLHVRTNCVQGNTSAWTTISFSTAIEPCNAPTGLTAANVTHNSADLSWNAQGASTYEYVVDQISTDPASGTATTGTTFNSTGLNPLTTYYLHVRTNCVQGNTSAWTTISFTTAIEPCNAPTGLAAANVTHNSADLSWNAQGATTYEYVVDQVSTDPASGTATTGTTFNPTGLNPLTTYYLHVRTNCVQGNTSAWATISFTTLIEPCSAPTGLAAANVTHNSADLSWNAQGASTYEYVVDQVSTDPASGTLTVGTAYNAAGLNQLTTYYLHVRTNCVQGNTSAWTTISFTTTLTPCIAPTGLAAANVTHNSANLSWNAQGSNTFEYVLDQTASDPLILGTPTTLTTYNPTTLSPSTTYYLHVRTDCSGANFSSWTTISFTTSIAPCDAPTGLTAANITQNTAELSWNTQAGSTYEYVVDQISTDPASGTATTAASYNASGLDAATTYYLHVRTHCAQGNTSGWTTIPFTTLPEPCNAPTGLTIANTTQNASDISWNVQGGNSFEYVLNQTASNPASGTATTANSYSASGLNASTTYYFHVRTNCGNGNFSTWTTVSFTTDDAPCIAPAGLTVSNITSSSANLNWTTQAGNTFQYVLDQTSTNPNAGGTVTSNNTFAATTLNSSSTYYFHVRTDCGNGNFSDWSTVSFTTASTVGLNEQEIISLSVYPNPAHDLVTIAGQTEGTATLITVNGQVLTTIDLEKQNTLDLSGYESGVYFIKYVSEKGTANVTVIKE